MNKAIKPRKNPKQINKIKEFSSFIRLKQYIILKIINSKPKKELFVIAITGTPGTGKTTLAKKLKNQLKSKDRLTTSIRPTISIISIKKIVKQNTKEYDDKNKCWVISETKIRRILNNLLEEKKEKNKKTPIKNKNKSTRKEKTINVIILDGHMSHYALPNKIDIMIVTKTKIEELTKRLKKRGYNRNKVRDNIESEIFDFCLNEAIERKHKEILVLQTDLK